MLALLIFALRLLYLFLIGPYELDGDEAQYWEWSRRLELSYYTKGPGVAWTIYFSRSLFGSTEAGVRFPAALTSCITMIALARLAFDLAGRSGAAAFYTAAAYALTAAYQFPSQFMTIDMPYFMCTALASLAALHAVRGARAGTGGWRGWLLLGLALGVGFLYKYTILLMLPGLAVYLLLQRKRLRLDAGLLVRLGVMVGVFAVAISPVIIWNHSKGWPTVSHLLGHMHMKGGDTHAQKSWNYSPMWTIEGIGTQLGAVGLPMMALLAMACWRAWRARAERSERWADELLLILLGAPVLVFYLAVSFRAEIEGNWPLAGYLPLLPLVGAGLAVEMPAWRKRLDAWRALPKPRPKQGLLTRRPQTPWQASWFIAVWWGVIAQAFILFAPFARALPGLNQLSGFDRVTGQQQEAAKLHAVRQAIEAKQNNEIAILAFKYRKTATLAFYLPNRPTNVYCGQHYFGSRRSPYDYFQDTNLEDPALLGRDFILVGLERELWEKTFKFDKTQVLDAGKQWYLGKNYGGPVTPVKHSD